MKLKFNIISAALLMLTGGMTFTSCNSEGDDFDYNKAGLFVSGTENNPVVKFVVEDTPASYPVTVQSTKKVDQDVKLTLAIDASKIDEYNKTNATNYFCVPDGAVELENPQVTISAGTAISTATTVRVVNTDAFEEGRNVHLKLLLSQGSWKEGYGVNHCRLVFLSMEQL